MGTWTHEWMDCGLFDQHHPFVRKGSPNVVILTYNMAYTLYTVNNFNSNTLKNYLTALVIFWSYFHNFRASSDFLGHILVIFPIFWSYLWSYFHYFGHIFKGVLVIFFQILNGNTETAPTRNTYFVRLIFVHLTSVRKLVRLQYIKPAYKIFTNQ